MKSSWIPISVIALVAAVLLLPKGCRRTKSNDPAPILLFNGTGTSPNDVTAFETILKQGGYGYDTADSARLNAMSAEQLSAYRLLLIPGGNYQVMGRNLSPETTDRMRQAVQEGVNYLGICAGGLLAGKADVNSLNLTSGVTFDFYAVVNRGIHKAAVPITCADMPVIEHYWEDGPQFTGWGNIVGRYPDETPAVVEGTAGKGWVILCGFHPEAPEKWRKRMNFSTNAQAANQYALTLIDAALNGRSLLSEPPRRD